MQEEDLLCRLVMIRLFQRSVRQCEEDEGKSVQETFGRRIAT